MIMNQELKIFKNKIANLIKLTDLYNNSKT